jgi:hypothetical protein
VAPRALVSLFHSFSSLPSLNPSFSPNTLGLFGCGDIGGCIYACCFPGCAVASTRSNIDGSSCCFNYCCMSAATTRFLTREVYGIPGGVWTDCLLSSCLGPCAANQVGLRGDVWARKSPAFFSSFLVFYFPFAWSLAPTDRCTKRLRSWAWWRVLVPPALASGRSGFAQASSACP